MLFDELYNQLVHKYPIDDLKYLLVIIIIFYITLFALRINGVYKKSFCPKCGNQIKRTNKTITDRIYAATTLGILPLRRYKCEVCYWKGLRWNTEKSYYVKKRRKRSQFQTQNSSHKDNTPTATS